MPTWVTASRGSLQQGVARVGGNSPSSTENFPFSVGPLIDRISTPPSDMSTRGSGVIEDKNSWRLLEECARVSRGSSVMVGVFDSRNKHEWIPMSAVETRACRGGGWNQIPYFLALPARWSSGVTYTANHFGFRCSRR